jgi:hypothetical protein
MGALVKLFGLNDDRNDLLENQPVRPVGGIGATAIGDMASGLSMGLLSRAVDLSLKATRTVSAPILRGTKSAMRVMWTAEGAITSSSRNKSEIAFTILPSLQTADRWPVRVVCCIMRNPSLRSMNNSREKCMNEVARAVGRKCFL